MNNYAIQTEKLSRSFEGVRVVDNLTLSVEVGEVLGFLGHNGAGKTTTVRLLNGVLKPDGGKIKVLGFEPSTDGNSLRTRTGVLTETPSLEERLTAVENLEIYADLYGVPQTRVRQRVENVLGQFGLSDRAGDKVAEYSKGMKQRLALARAFLHEPELIFLDEPTSGLDPIAMQEVHNMIRHVSADEGRTVFLCTHNLVEAQRLCDRVAVMQEGRLITVGSPRDLAQEIGAELRYTLDVDHLDKTYHILNHLTAVQNICTDDGLTITVSNREAVPDLLTALITEGIRVYELTPHNISLEDIYMALHQHEEGFTK